MASEVHSFKAYVLAEHRADLVEETRELNTANLQPTQVVVRTKCTGVCHSDLHFWHGNFQIGKTKDKVVSFASRGFKIPRVLGHEISGEVFALGEKAVSESGLKKGDRVIIYPWLGCEACSICESGNGGSCMNGSQELGFRMDGGYSELVQVPHYRFTIKIPESLPYDIASLLPCSALTAYSALKKIQPVVERFHKEWGVVPTLGVIGLGGLGQWSLKLLKHIFSDIPLSVIGFDISPSKADYIVQEGLLKDVFLLDSAKSPGEQCADFSDKFKKHLTCVLDFANTTETFAIATSLLAKTGALVSIGLHGGLGEIILPRLVVKAISIQGVYVGSLQYLEELLELVTKYSIQPPMLKKYPLSEASQAVRDLDAGRVMGRAVLECGQ